MKSILSAGLALSLLLGATAASAQPPRDDQRGAYQNDRGDHRGDHRDDRRGPPQDQRYDHHNWHKGGRVDRDEWRHGERIDYRAQHLRRPPRGYEWRNVNGDYVLGAIATGVIVDMLMNHH
jgi:Ni/Co efflux regulator RcnB